MTVYLVGAGPGDPGLLTVRGAEVLGRADVVVYDRLSVSSLLDLAPAGAELVNVGKAPGRATMDQDQIGELLVARGRAGLEVVRLKGGDPFVFARGGEEAAALAAAGVVFEVVPGVTSAIAAPAYAGIPLTLRHSSTSFTVVTGHEDPATPELIDWEAVAAPGRHHRGADGGRPLAHHRRPADVGRTRPGYACGRGAVGDPARATDGSSHAGHPG